MLTNYQNEDAGQAARVERAIAAEKLLAEIERQLAEAESVERDADGEVRDLAPKVFAAIREHGGAFVTFEFLASNPSFRAIWEENERRKHALDQAVRRCEILRQQQTRLQKLIG